MFKLKIYMLQLKTKKCDELFIVPVNVLSDMY